MSQSDPKKVVVIDDSDISRELVSRALREAGIEVVSLESAVGSTQVIFREEPDLVLIDVNMPTLSGERLAEILKNNKKLEKCQILLYSGTSEEELTKIVQATGADGFVPKTGDTDALVAHIQRALTGSSKGPGGRGRGTILVVDDSSIALDAVRLSLEPAGYEVITTESGERAAELVLEKSPDVVLIDVNMPTPGTELAEVVRRVCRTPGTRVLLHSSESVGTLEKTAEQCGAHGYVTKTSDPDLLIRQIEKWLG